jgi:hypothetical protein
MKVGSRPQYGEAVQVGKWYIGFELLTRPPYRVRVFQPFLFVWCFKIVDAGEPSRFDGRPMVNRGGWWRFTSPIGIVVEIIR